MRETTTVTRRVIMAKVKNRPNQRHQNVTPSRPYNPERKAVPELFDRLSSARVPIAIPEPWWSDFKAMALAISLILIMICAVYFSTRSSANVKRPSSRAQQEILKPPAELNIRPMGFSSSSRSSPGEMSQGQSGGSAGNPGLAGGSLGENNITVGKRRSGTGQAEEIEGIDLSAPGQLQKLILPSEVAGNCNIGKNSINDLSQCLALNGARVDR